jgi:methylenetetrahydrofolate dehydrogenase (NADP+) / methenyltetrahydrofolate cyclohydrolase
MKKIIDGEKIARKIARKTIKQVQELRDKNITATLAVVLVGDNKASQTYVDKKEKLAKKIGIQFKLYKFKTNITEQKLTNEVERIQKEDNISGLIIQLPLPEKFNVPKILTKIEKKFDVDILNPLNQKDLKNGTLSTLPPTPGAIIEILKNLKVNIQKQTVTIIGMGILVGKPLSYILKNMGVEKMFLCNSKTKNIKEKCLQSDIIITAVGKRNLITENMLKKGSIIIDAGTSFYKGKIYGDVDFEKVSKKAKHITPVPGGVGPITVIKLIENTVLYAKKRIT